MTGKRDAHRSVADEPVGKRKLSTISKLVLDGFLCDLRIAAPEAGGQSGITAGGLHTFAECGYRPRTFRENIRPVSDGLKLL
jgi:hypothetical protein